LQKKKLVVKFGGHSIAGNKASNEDAFTAMLPSKHAARKYKGAVACIADGVSCSDNAQLASQTAVTNFISDYYSTPEIWSVQQSAQRVLGAINSWLYQHGQQRHVRADGLVTTFSALICKSHTAHILHVGDSRVYLLRDNELRLLTKDHCYQRGDGESYLTRALGIEASLDIDYQALDIKVGDRFVLTTDGVHDTFTHAQLLDWAGHVSQDSERLAKQICQEALEAGSEDNISCLLVDIEALPVERVEEAYRKLTQQQVPPALSVGNKLDHYEIIKILHAGTRSHVYQARSAEDDQVYVLKAPSINFADDIEYLESFVREQWVGRKLQHRQIMKMYAQPNNSQFLYHVCDFVQGKTVRQWMVDNPDLTLDRIRSVLTEMISAVRVLHRNNMVHRDLKPENFMIDQDDNITLIDFGTVQVAGLQEISSPVNNSMPVGDIGYIAPEYLLYGKGNACSDLFSLACIVYEMLAHKQPFDVIKTNHNYPKRYDQWKYKPLNSLAKQNSVIPDWIDTVLKKALSANPTYRYQAMSEFQGDLYSPSKEMQMAQQFVPLLERNPLRFWKLLSVVLFIIIVVQFIYIFQ